MQVLLAITESHPGGAQEVVLGLLEELPAWGIRPVLVCGGQGVVLRRARELGLPAYSLPHLVRPLNPAADVAAYRELAAVVREVRPQLIHGHSFKAGLLTRLAGERLGIPTLFTVHGWSVYHRLPPPLQTAYMAWERHLSRSSASAYVCAADMKVAQRWGLSNPSFVVPNGVRERGVGRGSPLPPAVPWEFLAVARLSAAKAPLRTARVLGELARLAPHISWRLTWIGDGPQGDLVREEVRRQGLADRVLLLGAREDVGPFYRSAHVFLLLSRYEGSPLSVMEAMQARLLVAATAVGGVPELLASGKAGILLPPDATDVELARLLADALGNPAGVQAKRELAGTIGDRHTAQAMATAYAAVYRNLAGR